MDTKRVLGLRPDGTAYSGDRKQVIRYISLKLAAMGYWLTASPKDAEFLSVARDLLAKVQEQNRLLADHLCPADQRIQAFLDHYLAGLSLQGEVRLPTQTFVLDRHGLARELSIPVDSDHIETPILSSYRLSNGVLHNPQNDRRTTKGVFHIAEGGLPIPADKISVPKRVFGNLLFWALNPPRDLLRVPFTQGMAQGTAETFVSLLIRPVVCPAVPGSSAERSMEIRFFAPGLLVSNLDFVESIFGNAGDPMLIENDAGLDVEHWSGHTGCVILAPHLCELRKRDLGLPTYDQASELQRRQGMCWKDPEERYNGGQPFKLACRTADGVMVTVIADNYFGYCKKEVKTQLSFAANLFGLAEEEHAGGALAFPSYQLGDQFRGDDQKAQAAGYTFARLWEQYGSLMELKPEGHGVDKLFPEILYVPEDAHFDLWAQRVSWHKDGQAQSIPLLPDNIYMLPNGYKIRMEKHLKAATWSLVGTTAEGTFCHKPCTVSGGGKSEISKSISDAVLYGPIFIGDVQKDLDLVEHICKRDYSDRLRPEIREHYSPERLARPLLHPARSLGSVIKMLTPSPAEFTDEYNQWLESIPNDVRALVFIIKRLYKPEWGDAWRDKFGVDIINGSPGHEFMFGHRKLVGSYLRVGLLADGSWRTYKLRQDFRPADKVQMEDDISASAVVPGDAVLGLRSGQDRRSVKLVANCEYRLFQRPDDAIHRGTDKQTESDMAQPGLFCSNYEPMTPAQVADKLTNAIAFSEYTPAMQEHLRRGALQHSGYVMSSAHPRLVNGKPSQNPRYLQTRPDLARPRDRYLAETSTRFYRRIPLQTPVVFAVDAVLSGRRNNPPDLQAGIRPLAVYNPIHYQELPELFMDYICSLTGKSPSTTGAGSEGALTKGPFNALRATVDLNNALVSLILTDLKGFSTASGYVGPGHRVDHDISLLIPEIWCRLTPEERDPAFMISQGHLEKLSDFEYDGRKVLASRLGYRITCQFVHAYFGRIFDNPVVVFTQSLLQPESQDLGAFADGVHNIVEAQQRVAQSYFEDGSIDDACPPLRALLHIMAYGHYRDMGVEHPEIRRMFTLQYLLESDWYQERLLVKQQRDISLWQRHVAYLQSFMQKKHYADEISRLGIAERLAEAERTLARVSGLAYLRSLRGTIGADPLQYGSWSLDSLRPRS